MRLCAAASLDAVRLCRILVRCSASSRRASLPSSSSITWKSVLGHLDADDVPEECRGEHSCATCFGRSLRKWKMSKAKRNIGREILQGLRQLKRGEYGRVINIPDVASIRAKTGLSQAQFAKLMGVSVRTLQDWEQGRRAPSGAARTLLTIAARNPRILSDVG